MNLARHLVVPGRSIVLALIVTGAVAQLAGIVTVVSELVGSRRDAQRLEPSVRPELQPGIPAPVELGTTWLQLEAAGPMLVRMLRPNWRRVAGVVAVLVGLVLTTIGAVLALYLAPVVAPA